MFRLSIRHNSKVNTNIYIRTSTAATWGLGGSACLITGVRATKPIIRAAKLATRSAKPGCVKKTQIFVNDRRNIGTKKVKVFEIGILYRGIEK